MRRSKFEVACTLKGIELLVPDETNFEQARFIMLQTGNITLRSKQPLKFQHTLDSWI